MKLIAQIIAIVLLCFIFLGQISTYVGDFTFRSDGTLFTPENCIEPQTQDEYLYCGQRNCLNLIFADKVAFEENNVSLYRTIYDYDSSNNIEMFFTDNLRKNTFICNLNKDAVIDIVTVEYKPNKQFN